MSDVTLRQVTKIYSRDVQAVKDLSLHIDHGSFTVLLGPSGCGKTTSLRLIAGLEQPNEGDILINGKRVNHVPPQRRDVAVVFQSYALYPHMSVAQNIGFGLKMRGVSKSDIYKQVLEASRMLGLEGLLKRLPRQLSGGERQRVALGRAMVRDPAVFLLDEPLSNLDAILRAETRIELLKIQRRLDGTFVFVTHDQVEAMTLADVIAVMRDGILQQTGPPSEIYAKPSNSFVASFVGAPKMNLIEGVLVQKDGEILLKAKGFDVPIPEYFTSLKNELPDGKIIFGIRPEHIRVHSSDVSPSDIVVKVEVVELLGSQQFIYGTVDGDGQELAVSVDPLLRHRVGERLGISFPIEGLHFFHPETSNRIEP